MAAGMYLCLAKFLPYYSGYQSSYLWLFSLKLLSVRKKPSFSNSGRLLSFACAETPFLQVLRTAAITKKNCHNYQFWHCQQTGTVNEIIRQQVENKPKEVLFLSIQLNVVQAHRINVFKKKLGKFMEDSFTGSY